MAAHVIALPRRRAGRPRVAEKLRKTYYAMTRFNPDEADLVINAARTAHVTISQFIREAVISVVQAAENQKKSGRVGT